MKKVEINFQTTISERFYIERSIELLFGETIDSYRLRLHNPYTIVYEMAEILDKYRKNQLKNDQYVIALADEMKSCLTDDVTLVWNTFSKENFFPFTSGYKKLKR